MGYLKKFAKETQKEATEVTSVRIPKNIHSDFKRHCEKYNLSISESINILISRELLGNIDESSTEVEKLKEEIRRLNSIIDKIITQ
jgi:hypothetical protein